MKKIFFNILILLLTYQGLAQTTMKLNSEGNLGIGTLDIPEKLTVQGKIRTQLNANKFGSLHVQDGENDDLFLNYEGAANTNEGIGFQIGGISVMNIYQNRLLMRKDLMLLNGSTVYVNGVDIADYVFRSDYNLLSIEEQGQFMEENRHLPSLHDAGKIEQDGSFDLTERNEQAIEELEKAHLYIQELNNKIKRIESQNESLEERLSNLELLLKKYSLYED